MATGHTPTREGKCLRRCGDEVEALYVERNRYWQALKIIAEGKRLRTSANGKQRVMHYSSYDALQDIAKAALSEAEAE